MTDDLTELDGVGPSREESFNEEGIETYADLAESDPEALSDTIQRLPEDTALELVVQAQNMADLEEASVEEDPEPDEEELDEEADELEEELMEEAEQVIEEEQDEFDLEEEEEEDDPEPETYTLTLDLDGKHEYDTLYHTLIEERCTLHRTNRGGTEMYEEILDELRDTTTDGSLTIELEGTELNDLHNTVMQSRTNYQGQNLTEYMNALRRVENNINAAREEHLF